MLEQTFIHIPGIGPQTERLLWEGGIRCWDDAERFEKRFGVVGARLQQKLDEYIPRSKNAVRHGDAAFFERLCAVGEAWRAFPEFADKCVYLDIETTGLSSVFDTVTLVGLYDGRKYKVFVDGDNLDKLPAELQKYSMMVTYNGSGFDLRFLKLRFPELTFPPIHVDLRWITRRLGMQGGLKEVENQLRIRRPDAVADIDGYEATVLWSKYQRGVGSALDQLIQYNTEDVVHLKAIMEIAYDRLCEETAALRQVSGASMFNGVADIPTAKKRTRAANSEAAVSVVDRLIEKCGHAARVVGIDLTGSERRATGWSLMDGAMASTRSIVTDEDLIRETFAAKPDIVSIDSPLSLPENNNGQPDAEGPIYRKCELALKRMGISVFWCLLPSMRSLTFRGMKLANEMRAAGLRVIESYPGAAQDLLNIPRKGASLEELKWGLHRAGIEGEYLTARVTHDEVDAITSALVGLFYLADDYIALGTPTEDYLIVPRSPKINYSKLGDILSSTGLDGISESNGPC